MRRSTDISWCEDCALAFRRYDTAAAVYVATHAAGDHVLAAARLREWDEHRAVVHPRGNPHGNRKAWVT